jgi:hypothetical protein
MAYRREGYLQRLVTEPERIPQVSALMARYISRRDHFEANPMRVTHPAYYRGRVNNLMSHVLRSRSVHYNRVVLEAVQGAARILEGQGLFLLSSSLLARQAMVARGGRVRTDDRPTPEEWSEMQSLLARANLCPAHELPQNQRQYVVESEDRYWMVHTGCALFDIDTCPECRGAFMREDMRSVRGAHFVCASCVEEGEYQYSDFYNCYIHNGEAVEARMPDGHYVTASSEDRDFVWDDEDGEYIHRSLVSPTVINGYHSSRSYLRFDVDEWSAAHNNRMFGVELEVEVLDTLNRETVATRLHRAINEGEFGRNVFFENDGSLNYGVEIITQPRSLPAQRELFRFLQTPETVAGLRSHSTGTCGLHVHVSRTGLTNLQLARAVLFINDANNEPFIHALARRYNTGYCRVYPKQLDEAHLPGDRYESVNLTRRDTVEFRLFRGSLRYEAVVAAIEFCHALLEFCANPDLTVEGLRWLNFLAWCSDNLASETTVLREYVQGRLARRNPAAIAADSTIEA